MKTTRPIPPGKPRPVAQIRSPRAEGQNKSVGFRRFERAWSGRPGRIEAAGGFTLIELMVVVAIIAIIMTMSVPLIRSAVDRAGIDGAAAKVQDICAHARAQAILNDTTVELRIHPKTGVFEVGGASAQPGAPADELFSPDVEGNEWRAPSRPAGGGGRGSPTALSLTLEGGIFIEGLGINGLDYTEDEVGRIRFRSEGLGDEMTVVLTNERNEKRNVWLEVVTGFAHIETDVYKFHAR